MIGLIIRRGYDIFIFVLTFTVAVASCADTTKRFGSPKGIILNGGRGIIERFDLVFLRFRGSHGLTIGKQLNGEEGVLRKFNWFYIVELA
jgi:hypothetical protein